MAGLNKQQYALIKTMEKIQVFDGLDIKEIITLLRVCQTKTYKPEELIYRAGDASDEMLVLLRGKLLVTSLTGQMLAEIPSGNAVGEMGLFTGEPRSANIFASEPSTGLVLDGRGVRKEIKRLPDMYTKILENVVGSLSERLADANNRLK